MIEVEALSKSYGSVRAVHDVSFQVSAGEVVGFLGPNGAGKTTLLKMLCTWLAPDAGRIRIADHDALADPLEVRRSVGYLPEHNPLYETMRVDRFLAFLGDMHGLPHDVRDERMAWVVKNCQLGAVLGKRIQQCSKGFRQRIGLAGALLHDPPVVLLDEPTHGLDPLQVAAFLEFVRGLAPGHAILFSSHVLSEVVKVADRILVIHEGSLLLDERVDQLRGRLARSEDTLEDHLLELVRGTRTRSAGAGEVGS